MPETWTRRSLGGLVQTIAMGPFGSSIKKDTYTPSGVPVINGKNLHDVRLGDHAGYEFISPEHAEKLSRSIAYRGDVVITHRGTLGQASVIPEHSRYSRYVVSQSQLLIRPDRSKLSAAYLAYYLRSSAGQFELFSYATQTGVPAISQPTASISRLIISVPSPRQQQAIVEVLGALDDKIAANTKLADTVDRFLAAHFSRLTDEASTIRLGEIATVNPGICKPVRGGSLRYIDISSVGLGTLEFPEISSWDDAPSRARRHVQPGDTLWSTVRPNRRSHTLNLSPDQLLVGSTGLAVLRPRDTGFAYLYEATKTPSFTAYLENVAEGSAYPAVRAKRFEDAPIEWIAGPERESFEMTAAPLRRTLQSLDEENVRLGTVRDALLPQLMSGKLNIREAEDVLAAQK